MNARAYLALILAGIGWGLGFPLGKLALAETDAAHLILLRFAIAALFALPFAVRSADQRALFRSPPIVVGGALYGLAFIVQFEGLTGVTVTLAALLVGVMPALIAVGARFVGDQVSRAAWIGVVAATAGAVLIAARPGSAGTPLGVGLSVLSLLLFLAWLMLLRRAPKAPTEIAIPAVQMIIAAATVLPLSWFMHGPPKLDLSFTVWAAIIALGVFSTFLATAAWQYGSARVDPASAGVFINIEPLMGSMIGVLLFGDPLLPAVVIGGALIICGSFVVVLGNRPNFRDSMP